MQQAQQHPQNLNKFVCVQLEHTMTVGSVKHYECKAWAQLNEYDGYKLTYAQMGALILSLSLLFAIVFGIKRLRSAINS